ncbi:MAG: hypothetical protein LBC53_06810 [Spirochaetaceae bacterium]|jgi:hypothetical protein|nr:hypothetical protein [Spirochaetaceae bacterium]
MSTSANVFGRIGKSVITLIMVSAMIFASCEAVDGPGGLAGGDAALLASQSSANIVGINIDNVDDLELIGNDPGYPLNGNYNLTADLTLTDWIPIGDPNRVGGPFTGTFNGGGRTITVESFDASGNYVGVFAQTAGGGISNLTVNITAGIVGPTSAPYVGGLVGQATGTRFDGITITGTFDVTATTEKDIDFYVGELVGSAEPDTAFSNITIKACLNVLYTSTSTVLAHPIVKAGGVAGSIVGGKFDTATVNSQITVKADMPYNPDYTVTPIADNWLAVGGVAGYAENLAIVNATIDASTAVDGVSQQTQAYVGGVAGRGLNLTIDHAVSDAVVTGEGRGYNTSAGGVAGYIQQSRVTNSSASGDVAASGTTRSSDDLWQVYAGGLVGYSGGTLDGNSSIDHSYATGAVIAESPYPYAGGLVGYNYGYAVYVFDPSWRSYRDILNATATETYNGSVITSSYATGSVSAIATRGSGGLPYAGGLAGYSSIPVNRDQSIPNIANSYARGGVTATSDGQYAWAGGLVGSNAQGSVVATSYATGAVSVTTGVNPLPYEQYGINPGAAGGGIAGVNYYTDVSSTKDALITHSVALNPVITGSSVDASLSPYMIHRVAGDLGSVSQGYGLGALDDNYANASMVLIPPVTLVVGPNTVDGENVAFKPAQSFYENTLGWDFINVWTWGADNYPALQ